MALPSSGPISMSEIRAELLNDGKTSDLRLSFLGSLSGSGANRTSGYTPINQSSLSKPGPLFPASIDEWHGYNHSTNKACSNGYNLILGPQYSYVRYEVTGDVGASSTVTMYLPVNDDGNFIQCRIYTGSYPFTDLGTLSLTLTPNFNGEFTSAGYQYYNFDLLSSSTIVHIVAWDETSPSGNYSFFVNAGCGTTTTTTTIAPVTFATTATCNGSTVDILVDNFAGGTGTYSWIASGSFESTVNQNLGGPPGGTRYAIAGSSYTFTGIPESTTIYIGIQDSGGNRGIVAVNTPACATTTTTTTTTSTTTTTTTFTPTTTTTTTTLAPVDFTATPSCVNGAGEILVNNYTGGTGTYEWIAIGTSESSAATNVNNPATRFAAGTSYNFTGLSDGNYYIALKDNAGNSKVTAFPGINISCATTTTTTTTTSTTTTTTTFTPTTTTTTTTVSPVDFTATPSCVSGTGEILVNNYSGGTGTYQWIAIANNPTDAALYVNGSAGTRFTAGTSYNFTSLADGTYYVALRDSGGNTKITAAPGINISCATTTTTTTTTSTTTTTTTATPVYLYCTGYSSASDCCVAIDDYNINCGGGGGEFN